MSSTSSLPAVRAQEERRKRLATMKQRATALLGLATVVFLVVTLWGGDSTAAGYVQATAEAAMVGGLADWFAVTALFRHPLGIPIPHTAIVVARKNQFGETLGTFIQDAFLTPDAVLARLRAAQVGPRLAAWLQDPANADRLAGDVLDAAVRVSDLVSDDDVQRVVHGAIRTRVETVPVAPVAGRALDFLIRDGRHQEALDAVLREVDRFVDEHRDDLRDQLGPGLAVVAARRRRGPALRAPRRGRPHAGRGDARRPGPRAAARASRTGWSSWPTTCRPPRSSGPGASSCKADLLAQPEIGDWVGGAVGRREGPPPGRGDAPRRRPAAAAGRGRHGPRGPAGGARSWPSASTTPWPRRVTYVVDRFQGEIVTLVSGTIERWDAAETADRLELLLGPDLQFIRINGTVVGRDGRPRPPRRGPGPGLSAPTVGTWTTCERRCTRGSSWSGTTPPTCSASWWPRRASPATRPRPRGSSSRRSSTWG